MPHIKIIVFNIEKSASFQHFELKNSEGIISVIIFAEGMCALLLLLYILRFKLFTELPWELLNPIFIIGYKPFKKLCIISGTVELSLTMSI